jgi:hypothetical protein
MRGLLVSEWFFGGVTIWSLWGRLRPWWQVWRPPHPWSSSRDRACRLVVGEATLAGLGVFDDDLNVFGGLDGGRVYILRCGHGDKCGSKGQSQKQGAGLSHFLDPPDLAERSLNGGTGEDGDRWRSKPQQLYAPVHTAVEVIFRVGMLVCWLGDSAWGAIASLGGRR